MNRPGESSPEMLVRSRTVLLDVLEALAAHSDAVVLVGAQAVYLHTGELDVALAEATKDSDVALDSRLLGEDPLVEDAMRTAGLSRVPAGQPGEWETADGVPVDLIVPKALDNRISESARAAHIDPHDRMAARSTKGIEAAVVSFIVKNVEALDGKDGRVLEAKVASPAALLVAKAHKIQERLSAKRHLDDKDAHDAYRLFRAVETFVLADQFTELLTNELSAEVTGEAVEFIRELFAAGPDATGSKMAGRAEQGIGDPDFVAESVSILATELMEVLDIVIASME
jgi:hypothetical protein